MAQQDSCAITHQENEEKSTQEISKELGDKLETSLKKAKKLDNKIAKTITRRSRMAGLPVVGKFVHYRISSNPLGNLESNIRSVIMETSTSIIDIRNKCYSESERIQYISEQAQKAKEEEWTPAEFLEFIENNSDIELTVTNDEGESIDIKEAVSDLFDLYSEEEQKRKIQHYADWLEDHIGLSQQYLDSMRSLCLIAAEWIEGMSRRYYDVSQLRIQIEKIEALMHKLDHGKNTSISIQDSIREYGKLYTDGMQHLLQTYKELSETKSKNAEEFQKSLANLKKQLNTKFDTSRQIDSKPGQAEVQNLLTDDKSND